MNLHDWELAGNWHEVEPRSDAPDFLVEQKGRLYGLNSEFLELNDFGPVGPVDCPIAYDSERQRAFRYVCAADYRGRDFSQLRSYDLQSGDVAVLLDMPLNRWALWLLEWIGGTTADDTTGRLFGLMATDRPVDDRIVIEHQLFLLQAGVSVIKQRPLCRDAYRPLDFSRKRRELLFSGAEGIYLVGFKGERKATLKAEACPSGHGGSFKPDGQALAAIGGDGIYIWDLESNTCKQLTARGRFPVWSTDGLGIWYRESSSDLFYYDLNSHKSTQVLGVKNVRSPELWYARPPWQSQCGRYLSATFTAKRLKGVSRKANASGDVERVYSHHHALCILDLKTQSFWSKEGFTNHFRWMD